MAIRFNTKKYNQVKAEYLKFLEKGSASASLMREFDVYKIYLDADEDIKAARLKQASKPIKVELIKEAPKKAPQKEVKKTSQVTKKISQNKVNNQFETLSARIEALKITIRNSKVVSSVQRKEIEQLHHDVIFIMGLSDRQQLQLNRRILDLQDVVNNVTREQRLKPINDMIEELKLLALEDGFVERRKLIRTKIKTDKRLSFEDVKILRHRLNHTVPYSPVKELHVHYAIDTEDNDISLPESMKITVPWKDITFHENVIRIGTPIVNKPILIKTFCRRSYNTIKELLAEKLPEIIIEQAPDGTYKLVTSIELDSAVKLMKKREAEELFNDDAHHRPQLGLKRALLIAEDQESLLRRLRERKQRFINYLISLHSKLDYKVIPAVELLAHVSSESIMEEDAFIFTIPSRRTGCVCIVYENVNVARASLLFVVLKNKYMECLQSIFNYMADENIRNKRENLRARPTINVSGVLSVYHVNHTEDMHDWTEKLKR